MKDYLIGGADSAGVRNARELEKFMTDRLVRDATIKGLIKKDIRIKKGKDSWADKKAYKDAKEECKTAALHGDTSFDSLWEQKRAEFKENRGAKGKGFVKGKGKGKGKPPAEVSENEGAEATASKDTKAKNPPATMPVYGIDAGGAAYHTQTTAVYFHALTWYATTHGVLKHVLNKKTMTVHHSLAKRCLAALDDFYRGAPMNCTPPLQPQTRATEKKLYFSNNDSCDGVISEEGKEYYRRQFFAAILKKSPTDDTMRARNFYTAIPLARDSKGVLNSRYFLLPVRVWGANKTIAEIIQEYPNVGLQLPECYLQTLQVHKFALDEISEQISERVDLVQELLQKYTYGAGASKKWTTRQLNDSEYMRAACSLCNDVMKAHSQILRFRLNSNVLKTLSEVTDFRQVCLGDLFSTHGFHPAEPESIGVMQADATLPSLASLETIFSAQPLKQETASTETRKSFSLTTLGGLPPQQSTRPGQMSADDREKVRAQKLLEKEARAAKLAPNPSDRIVISPVNEADDGVLQFQVDLSKDEPDDGITDLSVPLVIGASTIARDTTDIKSAAPAVETETACAAEVAQAETVEAKE